MVCNQHYCTNSDVDYAYKGKIQKKRTKHSKAALLIECIGLLELIILSILPVFKVYLAMPMDKGAFNVYMGFLFWCVVFGVSVFSFCLVITCWLSKNARSIKKKICSFLDNCYLN